MTTVPSEASASAAAIAAGLAVRQRQEDDVVAGEDVRRRSARAPARPAAPGAAGATPSGWPALLAPVRAPISTLGVAEQQAQQLAAGVPAGTGDGDGRPAHVA